MTRLRALAIVSIVTASACALSISELEPFPCAKDGTCPTGYTCAPGRGCVRGTSSCSELGNCPSSAPVAACRQVVRGADVACGANEFTVSCSDGTSCPRNSSCSLTGGGECTCRDGYTALQCGTDVLCEGACIAPNWGCYPSGLLPSCIARNGVGGSYQCADGRTLPARCDAGCEEACSAPSSDGGVVECGAGTANPCSNGCCIGATCHSGTEDFACGRYGGQCAVCSDIQRCTRNQGPSGDVWMCVFAPSSDAGEEADAGFDAGVDAGSGPILSSCVAQSASHSDCNAYCATVGRTCVEQCPQPNGATGLFGAFAWPTSSSGCPGDNAGSASCSYDWGDSTPIQRWKCCCQ